jgi:hypothetical protein
VERRHRAMSRCGPTPTTPRHEGLPGRVSRPPRSRATSSNTRWRSSRRMRTSASPRPSTTASRRADRHQERRAGPEGRAGRSRADLEALSVSWGPNAVHLSPGEEVGAERRARGKTLTGGRRRCHPHPSACGRRPLPQGEVARATLTAGSCSCPRWRCWRCSRTGRRSRR